MLGEHFYASLEEPGSQDQSELVVMDEATLAARSLGFGGLMV
jgi:hypothetical protein